MRSPGNRIVEIMLILTTLEFDLSSFSFHSLPALLCIFTYHGRSFRCVNMIFIGEIMLSVRFM